MKRRSTEKVEVAVDRVAGKLWAVVRDPITREKLLVPSFEDLFRIDAAIVYCERLKYPRLPHKADDMLRGFHHRSMDVLDALLARGWPIPAPIYHSIWASLAREFQIPVPADDPSAFRPGEDDPPPPEAP